MSRRFESESYKCMLPVESLSDELSKQEQKTGTFSEVSTPTNLQHLFEIVVAVVAVGLLLLLCNFISHDWLTCFYLEKLNLHRPL